MATIPGTGGNDTLNDTVGTSDYYDLFGGNDTVLAGAGNDSLFGGGGVDTLRGGSGNDYIDGGTGADSLFGDDGDDTIVGGVSATGGASTAADSIDGGAGNDLIFGGAGGDVLDGGADNDTIDGGTGNDTIIGGSGFDYASYSRATGAVTVNLGSSSSSGAEGTDSLTGIEGVIGGFGADTITGNGEANRLLGMAGNDIIDGGGGNDTLEGGLGDDSLNGGDGIDTASFNGATQGVNASLLTNSAIGEGNDTLVGIENLTGSGFNDTLTGNDDANVLDGAEGNDNIIAGGGTDSVFGGIGNDTVDGGAGDDLIYGGPDTGELGNGVNATRDFNWIDFGNGADLAAGVSQNTGGINVDVSYRSGAGDAFTVANNTQFTGGGPFATNSSAFLNRPGSGDATGLQFEFSAVPGSGFADEVTNVSFRINDVDRNGWTDVIAVYAYDAAGNLLPVTFSTTSTEISLLGDTIRATGNGTDPNLADGSVLVTVPGPVARIVVEYSNANVAGQFIQLTDVHFTAVSLVDNDLLIGGAGNDSLFGGIGNDTIDGGIDNDQLFGGSGNDSLSGGTGNDLLDGGAGDDTLLFGSGDDSVYGGDGDDLIDDIGGSSLDGINLIYGGSGDDTVWAGGGADSVFGDAGDDVLNGDDGDDSIFGGTGDDAVNGGAGADSLFGDAGDDVVSGGTGDDTIFGGAGRDTLSGGNDRDVFLYQLGDADIGESVDGGGGGDDFDILDLRAFGAAYGWSSVLINPTGPEAGTVTLRDQLGNVLGTIAYTDIEEIIPCFTPGTLIETEHGARPVESLCPGDRVLTRDNGLQPLRWIGQRHLSLAQLMAQPHLQPVRIAAGALGEAGPARDLMVSPQHRVLVEGARAEMLFGEVEVLVPAKHLQGDVVRELPLAGVTFVHLLFDRHEIVLSEGLWTESFQPAERMLSAMDAATRDEVLELFPGLAESAVPFQAARLSLKAHEARVLLAG
jgi:Ca2+-binding RTX toxin-like protein